MAVVARREMRVAVAPLPITRLSVGCPGNSETGVVGPFPR